MNNVWFIWHAHMCNFGKFALENIVKAIYVCMLNVNVLLRLFRYCESPLFENSGHNTTSTAAHVNC